MHGKLQFDAMIGKFAYIQVHTKCLLYGILIADARDEDGYQACDFPSDRFWCHWKYDADHIWSLDKRSPDPEYGPEVDHTQSPTKRLDSS